MFFVENLKKSLPRKMCFWVMYLIGLIYDKLFRRLSLNNLFTVIHVSLFLIILLFIFYFVTVNRWSCRVTSNCFLFTHPCLPPSRQEVSLQKKIRLHPGIPSSRYVNINTRTWFEMVLAEPLRSGSEAVRLTRVLCILFSNV